MKKHSKLAILNLNPDSFSDSDVISLEGSLAKAETFINRGFDYIDIGGQSTRPGASAVPVELELSRLLPFIENYSFTTKLSLDSFQPEVVQYVFARYGNKFAFLNDVTGLQNSKLLEVVAGALETSVQLVCMHNKGGVPPSIPAKNIPDDFYEDGLFEHMKVFFDKSIKACRNYGIDPLRLVLDPGLGFGKNVQHSLEIIDIIPKLRQEFGLPILVGASRKSFLRLWKDTLEANLQELDVWTAEYNAIAIEAGADFIRVH